MSLTFTMRFALLLSLIPVLAFARPPTSSRTEAARLFDEGRALMSKKKYVQACERFEQSYRLEPALGALLNFADCMEFAGKPARAFMLFNDAAAWAARNHEAQRETVALERAKALKPKLSSLIVEVSVRVVGAKISLNAAGAKEELYAWNVESAPQSLPLDAGTYELTINAPGHFPASFSVNIPAVPGPVRITAPALEPLPPPPPKSEEEPAPSLEPKQSALEPPPSPPLVSTPSQSSPQRGVSFGLGVAGVSLGGALLISGAIGLFYTKSIHDRFLRQQPGGPEYEMPTLTRTEFDTAASLYVPSWVGVGVGAVAVGTGIWLLLRSPPKNQPTVAAVIHPNGAALTIQGSF